MICVGGLDLAALEKRSTGIAVICNNELILIGIVHKDEEIFEIFDKYRVKVIAIDAPLSHAKGYRKVDLKMKRLGFKVLPPGWSSMKMLVDRALKVKSLFEKKNIKVIETHPLSALRSSGAHNLNELLKYMGINIAVKNRELLKIRDVADAVIAAIVAKCYIESRILVVEDVDGAIYLIPQLV